MKQIDEKNVLIPYKLFIELIKFFLSGIDIDEDYVKEELEKKIQARARLKIKNLRLENNKSQKEIAKYLEVDLSTYNKYEKGSRKLSNEVVKKLAEYYNISVSDIVD